MSNRYLWMKPDTLDSLYELHDQERKIATVRFEAFRSRAQAAWNGIQWIIDRTGDGESMLSVSGGADPASRMAGMVHPTGRCNFVIDRQTFHWRTTSVWSGEMAWMTDQGRPLIQYRPRHEEHRLFYDVEVLPNHLNEQTRILLLLVGGYLSSSNHTDLVAARAGAAATVMISD